MNRIHGWRARLTQWADAQVGRPFIWGQTDCASLARQACAQLFGRDVFPHLPVWDTARGALEALQQGGSIEEILHAAGALPISITFLRAGDIIVVREPQERIGRVTIFTCVDGVSCITGSTEDGVVRSPRPPAVDDPRCVYSLWEVADNE